MIGDFPATARLQRAFNDLAVFRGLVWLLVAGMIFQAAFLVHSASTFRSILNKANAHAVLLSGIVPVRDVRNIGTRDSKPDGLARSQTSSANQRVSEPRVSFFTE